MDSQQNKTGKKGVGVSELRRESESEEREGGSFLSSSYFFKIPAKENTHNQYLFLVET